METILAHAQQLVYILLSFMPSQYQRESLEAMLGLFLEVACGILYHNTVERNPPVQ